MTDDRTPVLIGAGQITQREEDPNAALSPLDLTAKAARAAADDAGGGQKLLESLDTIVRSARSPTRAGGSPAVWRLEKPAQVVASRIGATNARRLIYTYPGGNMPQWCVNRLFEKITSGEVGAALIAGGEALATQKAAQRAKIELDWNEDPGGTFEPGASSTRGWNDVEERHRMAGAIFAYPLFENASAAPWPYDRGTPPGDGPPV